MGPYLRDDALAANAGRGRLGLVIARVHGGWLVEDRLGLVDGLGGGLVVDRLWLLEVGGVGGRGVLRIHRGSWLVLHVEEPLGGVVLVLVQRAGGGVEGGGGVGAEGDRLVGVHLCKLPKGGVEVMMTEIVFVQASGL